MTLTQIRYFVTICNHRTITGAAEELFVSQSTISSALKDLEKECGFLLLERTNKGTQPTPAGFLFLKQVEELLRHYDAIKKGLSEISDMNNSLKIGFTPFSCDTVFLPIIQQYQSLYPNSHLKIIENTSEKLFSFFDQGIIDFAIVPGNSMGEDWLLDYHSRKFTVDIPFCISCHINHPLAKLPYVTPQDIAPYSVLFWSGHSLIEKNLKTIFSDHGVSLSVQGHLDQISSIITFIQNNMGIAFLAISLLKDLPSIIDIPFRTNQPCVELNIPDMAIIWKKRQFQSKAQKNFIHFITERAKASEQGPPKQ